MNIRFSLQITLIALLCYTYGKQLYYGERGIVALQQVTQEVKALKQLESKKKDEILSLEHEIYAWETDPYLKEKVAREQLLYSRTGEYVFIIPDATT